MPVKFVYFLYFSCKKNTNDHCHDLFSYFNLKFSCNFSLANIKALLSKLSSLADTFSNIRASEKKSCTPSLMFDLIFYVAMHVHIIHTLNSKLVVKGF